MNTMFLMLGAIGLLAFAFEVRGAGDAPATQPTTQPSSVHDFTVADNLGQEVDLSSYEGKVLLIVNTASRCGLTPQYAGLQKLYEANRDRGLAILAFPANEFGQQEPGSDPEIREFCTTNYGVSFDLFAKIVVKGDGIAPLYKFLTEAASNPKFAGEIGWNFTKFLISRDGQVVGRFEPAVSPDDPNLLAALETELQKQP